MCLFVFSCVLVCLYEWCYTSNHRVISTLYISRATRWLCIPCVDADEFTPLFFLSFSSSSGTVSKKTKDGYVVPSLRSALLLSGNRELFSFHFSRFGRPLKPWRWPTREYTLVPYRTGVVGIDPFQHTKFALQNILTHKEKYSIYSFTFYKYIRLVGGILPYISFLGTFPPKEGPF